MHISHRLVLNFKVRHTWVTTKNRHMSSDLAIKNSLEIPTSAGASPFILKWLDNREHILNSLLSNLDGMLYCCLVDAHWTMLFISDGCQKLTGYSMQEIFNNGRISYEELTLQADREKVRSAIEHAITSQERFEIEYRITAANGQIKWVLERGTAIINELGKAEAIEGLIQDISARKAGEIALQDAEKRYRSIFENTVEGIFQSSEHGQYLRANPALAKIYGYNSPDELINQLNDIGKQLYVDQSRREQFVELMQSRQQSTNFESQVYRRDGKIIWISENARTVRDEVGEFLYFEGTVEDITERKSYSEKIEYQATHDDLTGLPNRTLLKDRLQQAISNADRTSSQVAVVFVDLDKFKDVNDSMGHIAGDQLLITMGTRFASCLRDSDTVARPGGDEYVLILSNLHNLQALSQTLERILVTAAKPYQIQQREFIVTCSMGVSLYPDDGKDCDTLLKNADTAMYEAKKVGKNNFQFFTKDLNAILIGRLELEYRLRQALKLDEFVLHYQPKVSMQTNEFTGVEALIRWHNPTQGLISPAKFIPIAEESNLIEHMGKWIIQTACKESAQMAKLTGRPFPISVNVSARQFYHRQFVRSIESMLAKSGLHPSSLEIEITEGVLVEQTRQFINVLKNLKELGVKLAIDDFGTGYSSIGYLKHFPVDNLKIDQSFVRGLDKDSANQAILKAIVVLGHNLGLNVIAEGVETVAERDFLASIECDEMQGFLYSKPLPIKELTEFYSKTQINPLLQTIPHNPMDIN